MAMSPAAIQYTERQPKASATTPEPIRVQLHPGDDADRQHGGDKAQPCRIDPL